MAFERLRGIFGSKPPDAPKKKQRREKPVFQAVPEDNHEGEPITFEEVSEDDLGTKVIARPEGVSPDVAMEASSIDGGHEESSGWGEKIKDAQEYAAALGQEVVSMKAELKTVHRELEGMKEMKVNPDKWKKNIDLIEANGDSLDDQITQAESIFYNQQVGIAEKELELAQARLDLAKFSVKDKPSLPVSKMDKPSFVSVWDSVKNAMDHRPWRVSNYDEQRGVYGVTRGKGENMRSEDIPGGELEVLQTGEGRSARVDIADKEKALEEVRQILADYMEGKVVDARQNAYKIAEAMALEKKLEVEFTQGSLRIDKENKPRRRKRRKKA